MESRQGNLILMPGLITTPDAMVAPKHFNNQILRELPGNELATNMDTNSHIASIQIGRPRSNQLLLYKPSRCSGMYCVSPYEPCYPISRMVSRLSHKTIAVSRGISDYRHFARETGSSRSYLFLRHPKSAGRKEACYRSCQTAILMQRLFVPKARYRLT